MFIGFLLTHLGYRFLFSFAHKSSQSADFNHFSGMYERVSVEFQISKPCLFLNPSGFPISAHCMALPGTPPNPTPIKFPAQRDREMISLETFRWKNYTYPNLPTKKNQGNGGHLSDLDLAWNQLDAGGHEAAYALAHVLQISESRQKAAQHRWHGKCSWKKAVSFFFSFLCVEKHDLFFVDVHKI